MPWSRRRKPLRLILLAIVVGVLAGACGSRDGRGIGPTGPTTSGAVVVESASLRSQETCSGFTCEPWYCEVSGRIRNDGPREQSVSVRLTAFDRSGAVVGEANVKHLVVPAGGRASYSAIVMRIVTDASGFVTDISIPEDCRRVARLEISEIQAEG